MYTPRRFNEEETESLLVFIEQHSFATIVGTDDDGLPLASHVPVDFANVITGLLHRRDADSLGVAQLMAERKPAAIPRVETRPGQSTTTRGNSM